MANEDTELADKIDQEYFERATMNLMRFDEPTRRRIKPEMIEGLVRYKEQRIEPGSFLLAVLEGKLVDALNRADLYNQHSLPAIVAWCWNNMPSPAWGSPEKVRQWLEN